MFFQIFNTAHEVCHHFFSPQVRWDWENTLESMKVLEEINGNTLILHQIHKRVWLAAQRDTLFWSHIRKVPIKELKEDKENIRRPDDVWIVCNNSTSFIDVPVSVIRFFFFIYSLLIYHLNSILKIVIINIFFF